MSTDVQIRFNLRVPMRDGVELSADLYLPSLSPSRITHHASHITHHESPQPALPALLLRTPYVKANQSNLDLAKYFAKNGYAVIIMDVRGRGDSDGLFVPYRNEGRDGYDAIEWCAAQPWSNGKVATMGSSYLGAIQWRAALQQPPHLVTMIVRVTPSDPFVEWPTGSQCPMHLCWLHLTGGRVNQVMEAVDWDRVYWHLPLYTMDEAAGRPHPIWREQNSHTSLDDYWEPQRYQNKFHLLNLPVMHISGWYDDEQIGTPLNFMGMTKHAAGELGRNNQKLLMGPWGHRVNTESKLGEVDFGPDAIIDLRAAELAWLDRWMKGTMDDAASLKDEAPVRIFVMGENVWRDEQEWPLARTAWTHFYLHSGGRANSRFGDGALTTARPGDEPPDHYRYDPARPVPFITDPTSSQIGGPDDYAAIQRRDDVLVYVTPPLQEDVEITGPIRLHLYAATSAVDTDFMAMLVDVHPTGFVQRLCDGMVRARFREGMDKPQGVEPGAIYQYTIDLWNTSRRFFKGHRIGLQIASSAFPKYDRNLNTGEDLAHGARMQPADQTIYHNAGHPSTLLLPVIPRT